MSARRAPRASGAPYLLDTHIWIWYVNASARLHRRLRAVLDGASAAELWLSPISLWELALLHE
ncbi:MAG: PIN domain-containing protein, partial [Solirubrobacteraceae bacterium]